MVKVSPHFQALKREYIFPIIERKLEELKQKLPASSIVNLGVGDVSLPLAPAIIEAICAATQEMGKGVRGYGPTEGYLFLREAIVKNEFENLGIHADEIFISEGTNNDAANIQELFSLSNSVAVPDPTYPVYADANVMAGRKKFIPLPCTKETGFVPRVPNTHCDLIYLCTPNNPTGVALTKQDLAEWIAYAKKENAILLVDNAYSAFVTSPDVPRTIFEVEGAHDVAVEFRSFSKSAGFTGLRCAYTVLPKSVHAHLGRKKLALHALWNRRQGTKTNGVSYPIQRGAEAAFSHEGKKQTKEQIAIYSAQAKRLREGLKAIGQECYGGLDAPYIWWKTPVHLSSWEFFDFLLEKCQILSIPGKGFGTHGEGFVRLSAFTTPEKAELALERVTCALS